MASGSSIVGLCRRGRHQRAHSRSSDRGPHGEPDTAYHHSAPWYHDGVYSRFWEHYAALMYTSHLSVLEHAAYADTQRTPSPKKCNMRRQHHSRDSYSNDTHHLHTQPNHPHTHHQHQPCHRSRQRRANDTSRSRSRDGRHHQRRRRARDHSTSELTSQLSMGMHLNDDDGGMPKPVDAKFLAFVETSLRHREEWKMKKQGKADTTDQKEDLEKVEEHPDSVRAQDLQRLYGSAAPRMHAMETAVQLAYDRVATRHHPKLWPNIPINVLFGGANG